MLVVWFLKPSVSSASCWLFRIPVVPCIRRFVCSSWSHVYRVVVPIVPSARTVESLRLKVSHLDLRSSSPFQSGHSGLTSFALASSSLLI